MSLKRERARAMINDSAFDDVDASNDDLQLFVDGTVSPLKKKGNFDHQDGGRILHKPSGSKWERRFLVHVE